MQNAASGAELFEQVYLRKPVGHTIETELHDIQANYNNQKIQGKQDDLVTSAKKLIENILNNSDVHENRQ